MSSRTRSRKRSLTTSPAALAASSNACEKSVRSPPEQLLEPGRGNPPVPSVALSDEWLPVSHRFSPFRPRRFRTFQAHDTRKKGSDIGTKQKARSVAGANKGCHCHDDEWLTKTAKPVAHGQDRLNLN